MVARSIKSLFFAVAQPLMRVSGMAYKLCKAPRTGSIKVQLGPGQGNYLDGWVNVDANIISAKCDVWSDLRHPLPFFSKTVEALYSHHVIEHLPDLQLHFNEAFRCLKPGGVYRVGGPNGDSAIKKFVENDPAWFSDFPDVRTSIGGRFENFIFCKGEHVTILTYSFLQELMGKAGFINISQYLPKTQSGFPELFGDFFIKEYEADITCPHTLIVEGTKPNYGAL